MSTSFNITISNLVTAGQRNTQSNEVCIGDPIDLNTLIENQTAGGAFTETVSGDLIPNGILQTTGLPAGTLSVTYTVGDAQSPCGEDQLDFEVVLNDSPFIGNGTDTQLCQGASIDLFDQLDPTATRGGIWTNDQGNINITGSTFQADMTTTGTIQFTYTINDPICGDLSTSFNITISDLVTAGQRNTQSNEVCIGDPIDLNTLIENQTAGGAFTETVSGDLIPSGILQTMGRPAGTLSVSYTVGDAQSPCGEDQLDFEVLLNEPPFIGNGTDTQLCQGASIDLFDQLDPTATRGGIWTNDQGNIGINGSSFQPGTGLSGSVRFTYTVPDAICGNQSTSFTIVVFEPRVQAVFDNGQSCQGEVVNLLDLLQSGDSDGMITAITNSVGLSGTQINTRLLSQGTYEYEYRLSGNNCPDAVSTIFLTVSEPNSAGRDTSILACGGIIQLASLISGSPNGNFFENGALLANGIFNADARPVGNYSIQYITPSNGACPADSASINITLEELVQGLISGANTLCEGDTSILTAPPGFFNYVWAGGTPGSSLAVTAPGQYSVTYENDQGCISESSIFVSTLPSPQFNLEGENTICENESTILSIVPFTSQQQILWDQGFTVPQILAQDARTYSATVTDPNGCSTTRTFTLNTLPTQDTSIFAVVCEGESLIIGNQEISNPGQFAIPDEFGCRFEIWNVSLADEVIVSAEDDQFALSDADSPLNILANDNISNQIQGTVTISRQPETGSVTLLGNSVVYEPGNSTTAVNDIFEYVLCVEGCANICDTAEVSIIIPGEVCSKDFVELISNVITPDNNGMNDVFDPLQELEELGCNLLISASDLMIMNRWGEVIYHASPYVPWDASREGNPGKLLPQGTYYYRLSSESDQSKVFSGPISVLYDK